MQIIADQNRILKVIALIRFPVHETHELFSENGERFSMAFCIYWEMGRLVYRLVIFAINLPILES
jgi:hypothetical protein